MQLSFRECGLDVGFEKERAEFEGFQLLDRETGSNEQLLLLTSSTSLPIAAPGGKAK